ncbi:MAG: ergothioneine biosynthesis protein EgtB [Candidatus Kapaibacteriales bacterium]
MGHTTWYFEYFVLKDFISGYNEYDPRFNYIFNSYYNSLGSRLGKGDRGSLTRPGLAEIYEYRKAIDKRLESFISGNELTDKCKLLLEIGINHEQQHQELMIYDIKHILGSNPLKPPFIDKTRLELDLTEDIDLTIEISEGVYEIGHDGTGFGYDNEMPRHRIYQNGAKVGKYAESNGRYREFIEDGGYENPLLWLSDGWDFIKSNSIEMPLYWSRDKAGGLKEYTLFGSESLNANLPVCHISYYEADAFARWAGKRLPTEAELELVSHDNLPSDKLSNDDELLMFLCHPRYASDKSDNKQVLTSPDGVWCWSSSLHSAYPGYKRDEGALGEYNGKFMSDRMVLKVGSCATPPNHFRKTYRNFFEPTKRWLFSGIRLAEDN